MRVEQKTVVSMHKTRRLLKLSSGP